MKIVRGAQWRKVKGKKGEWKDFVDVVNRKKGGCMSDPGKHPVDVLAAFVKTFSKEKDIQVSLFLQVNGVHISLRVWQYQHVVVNWVGN